MQRPSFSIPEHRSKRGSSILEVAVATVVMGMFFTAVAMSYSTSLGVLRGQSETIAANLLMQERLDQLRANGWAQVSDAETLRAAFAQATSQEPILSGVRETITVSTYPPANPPTTPLRVERQSDGTAAIVSQPSGGVSLREMLAVRIDLRVEWTSQQYQRPRVRETSTVIAGGGALR